MALGGARNSANMAAATPPQSAPAATLRTSETATVAPAITRDEVARLEQRLARMEAAQAQARSVVVQGAPSAVNEDAVVHRVQALIDASEERQRRENITLISDVVRDYETQRRVDLRTVEERLGRIQGTTGLELQQHRDALNYIMRVSQSGR
jgi:hypothetical protein